MGFGHVGFGFPGDSETMGYYPTGNPFSSPGEILTDEQDEQSCAVLEADDEQDTCMREGRARRQENPGTYTLGSNHAQVSFAIVSRNVVFHQVIMVDQGLNHFLKGCQIDESKSACSLCNILDWGTRWSSVVSS